jgi:putative membrane protein
MVLSGGILCSAGFGCSGDDAQPDTVATAPPVEAAARAAGTTTAPPTSSEVAGAAAPAPANPMPRGATPAPSAPAPATPPAAAGDSVPENDQGDADGPVVIVRKYTDSEIAAVLLAANAAEIEESRLAAARAANPAVRDYAEQMLSAHTSANVDATMLFARNDVMPDPNDTSEEIAMQSDEAMRQMATQAGADFDRAYMTRQNDGHLKLLNLLDMSLIMSAVDVDLREMLEGLRPAVADHLQAARDLLSQL